MATKYVSLTGSDSNPGTITQPWKTWHYAMQPGRGDSLAPGDTLFVRGGTYGSDYLYGHSGSSYYGVRVSGLNGTSSQHIIISAYPGETPILDGQSFQTTDHQHVGIGYYSCSYIDFIGLHCTNFIQWSDNAYQSLGWYGSACNQITHTLCTNYRNGDGFALKDGSNNIWYTNCDSWGNGDRYNGGGDTPGGLANGFYAAPVEGGHIYYRGCRSYWNSDDGWDHFGGAGYIEYDNCWAFGNGVCPAGDLLPEITGDGAGFKLGPQGPDSPIEDDYQRILKNCLAFENTECGFDINTDDTNTRVRITLLNCTSASNGVEGYQFYWDDSLGLVKNCISYDEPSSIGDLTHGGTVQSRNSWNTPPNATVTSADFKSVDSTQALRTRNSGDGSLPLMDYLHLSATATDLIHVGLQVTAFDNVTALTEDGDGVAYANPPSIGAFEYVVSGTSLPSVTTTAVTSITNTTASTGGNVTSDGGATVTARGVCYATSYNPTLSNSYTTNGTGIGSFTSSLSGLTLGTTYHVRAYATNSIGTSYGSDVQFTTTGGSGTVLNVTGQTYLSTDPDESSLYTAAHSVATTFSFTNNSLTSNNIAGYLLEAGDEDIASTNNYLDGALISGNKFTWTGIQDGNIITHGLFIGYMKNDIIQYNYMNNLPFAIVTKSGTAAGVNMINTTGVIAYNVIKNSLVGIRIKGINGTLIYNNTFYDNLSNNDNFIYISPNTDKAVPANSTGTVIKNNIFYTTNGNGILYFEEAGDLSGLVCDYNIYYSETGNVYFWNGSSWLNFTQWQALGYDSHSYVQNPNFINNTSLVPAARIDRGTNLGTSYNSGLATNNTWTVAVSPITALQNGTWQVGAYVYGASGTVVVPTITTSSVTNLTSTSATCGGTITSDGGGAITSKGICYSTSPNPTILDTTIDGGTGSGTFSVSLTGLTKNNTYYARAYAVNSAGISYGSDVSFTTRAYKIVVF